MEQNKILHVYRWDLDKTYLDTDFRLHRIWKVPFESASAKKNIPGSIALIKELTSIRNNDYSNCSNKVIFISGSPNQMRNKIEEKFKIDGLAPDEIYLKPNLENFLYLRWRAIKEQIGYKLPLLLESRAEIEEDVLETCFGDDSESDALIYSMYTDLVAGNIGDFTLKEMLHAVRAYPDSILRARVARKKIIRSNAVQQIFIHLAMKTAPERFYVYGSRVVPIKDYFQSALCLYEVGKLTPQGVFNVAWDMISNYKYTVGHFTDSCQDIIKRGFFANSSAQKLSSELDGIKENCIDDTQLEFLQSLSHVIKTLPKTQIIPPLSSAIDYPALIHSIRHHM